MSKSPWYRDGLSFRCTACGLCCTGAPGYVWVNSQEIHDLAAAMGLPPDEFEARHVRTIGVRRSLKERADYDCVLLDSGTRKCLAYQARPRQCRTWPFWDSNLRTPDAWEATCQVCPGAGRGDLYDASFIDAQRRVISV